MNDKDISVAETTMIIQEMVDAGLVMVNKAYDDDTMKTEYMITPFGRWLFGNELWHNFLSKSKETQDKLRKRYESEK